MKTISILKFLWKYLWKLGAFIVTLVFFLAALVTVFPDLHKHMPEIVQYFSIENKILISIISIILLVLLVGVILDLQKLYYYLGTIGTKWKKKLDISLPTPKESSKESSIIPKVISTTPKVISTAPKESSITPKVISTTPKEKIATNHKLPKNQFFGATQSEREPIFISEPLQDIAAAKKLAQQQNKLVFAVIYDENHSRQSQIRYSLGCFMEYMTTKELVEEHFISVVASSSDSDAAALVPTDDPLENCFWVVFNSAGEVVRAEEVYANPKTGLERVKDVIAEYL